MTISPRVLKRRTFRSFIVFFSMALILLGSWKLARNSRPVDQTPGAFRTVLELNGRIWRSLYRSSRMNHAVPPPAGKEPRVNGEIGIETDLDEAIWTLKLVADDQDPLSRKLRVGLAELKSLPRVETSAEFYCIEGWSDPISYAGVRFSEFMKYYGMGFADADGKTPAFRYVGFSTPDEKYYVSIDMESMLHAQTVLAYEMNGEPLAEENGAPLRLIIPVKYGIKSLKRIGKIFFSNRRPPDYWAERGYDWFAGL